MVLVDNFLIFKNWMIVFADEISYNGSAITNSYGSPSVFGKILA